MVAEIYPRMTSLIKNSKWRRDLLKGCIGTIVGGVTLNPIPLGVISGTGLLLKTYSEIKNYKRKIEMSKFAYTSYSKVLTDLRSFMRGLKYDEKEFLDYVKVIDEIIIDMCPLTDKFEKKYNKVFIQE